MADGVTFQSATVATPAAGTEVATDDCGSDGQAQIVKIGTSTDGSAAVIPASTSTGLRVNVHDGTDALLINTAGSAQVDPRVAVTRIQVTPTVTATAYEAKDAIGGLLTFANAARTSGGSIHIESATIVDKAAQLAAMDLVLFRASISAPTDEAVFDPTDTELLDCVGTVHFASGAAPTGDWHDFNDNAVACVRNVGLTATPSGTSLYGVLVARGTPTFASTSDIVVTLSILQD